MKEFVFTGDELIVSSKEKEIIVPPTKAGRKHLKGEFISKISTYETTKPITEKVKRAKESGETEIDVKENSKSR